MQTQEIPEITVEELNALIEKQADVFVLDVRAQFEYEICNINGYLIPITELADRLHELDSSKQIVVHCHAGGRSRRAVEFLLAQGFANVANLKGGITAWAEKIDPTMARY